MMTPGAILNGKYRLIEQIGEGGMATIWRAVQISLDRPVAVKFLSVSGPSASKYVERFLEEAKVAAAIRHRNVIDIVDFGTSDQGTVYMVLELLQGESLAERMARLPALTLGEIVNIGVLVLSGLQAVHNAGVVHRDLKPENIFLVNDDDGAYPKLLDFGVSKSVDRKEGRAPTQEGMLVGTPQYMAPEQARGIRDIDHRIDVWATGVILYEALTGKLPYESENVGDILIKIVSEDAPPITFYRPEVGPELSAVVQRAMTRNRDERYQDAKEMRAALMDAAARMGDAAGMWGRITPGGGTVRAEELRTPISGLIQVVAVEHARAVQRAEAAVAAAGAATGPQKAVSQGQAADALAKTIPAMDLALERDRPSSVSAPVARPVSTDDAQVTRSTAADSVLGETARPASKKTGGAVWVFLGILVLGGGAAATLVLYPELLDRLNELVGGAGANPENTFDLGAQEFDAGTLEAIMPDLVRSDAGSGETALPVDAGSAAGLGLSEDAGLGEDAGLDQGAQLDAGVEHTEQLRPTKRVVRRHPTRHPGRRPVRRPGRRR